MTRRAETTKMSEPTEEVGSMLGWFAEFFRSDKGARVCYGGVEVFAIDGSLSQGLEECPAVKDGEIGSETERKRLESTMTKPEAISGKFRARSQRCHASFERDSHDAVEILPLSLPER